VKGNPVINAGSDLTAAIRRFEKMEAAFERENALRDKVVKAMAKATGITEKVFVNETGPVIEARLANWVKDTKNKARKGYAEIEEEVQKLKEDLREKRAELEGSRVRVARIQGVAEQLCADIERRLKEMAEIKVNPVECVVEELEEDGEGLSEVPKKRSKLEEQILSIRGEGGMP
jgi:DNA repair exonuclease SbcCD ATPase subunit